MDYNKIASELVIKTIKEKKMTREELAELAGAEKYKLDNYLQGKAKWDINYLARIFFILDLSMDDSFGLSVSYPMDEINVTRKIYKVKD